MNTLELIHTLTKYSFTRNTFCGVYAIDELPQKRFHRPCSFIVNTDDSSKPGQHWFGIFLPKFGSIEYFDSFGVKPINEEILNFFKMNGNKWIYNNIHIQSDSSETCGKFCVLFLCYRSRGMSFKNFLNLFSPELEYNEIFVDELFRKLFDN
jgi:hypothetical protein